MGLSQKGCNFPNLRQKFDFSDRTAIKVSHIFQHPATVTFFRLRSLFSYIVILLEKGCSHLKGPPAPAGRALTNDLCGQYFNIKVKINAVLAKIILMLNDYNTSMSPEIDVI